MCQTMFLPKEFVDVDPDQPDAENLRKRIGAGPFEVVHSEPVDPKIVSELNIGIPHWFVWIKGLFKGKHKFLARQFRRARDA